MAVSFKCPKKESLIIKEIANRAVKLWAKNGLGEIDHTDIEMDVMACHCNGVPLNLVRLMAADDFNFAHDIGGIRRHLDRNTGKLTDHFIPRFAA